MNKKILLPVTAFALVGAALFASATAFAQDTSSGTPTIVAKIASRFGLPESDVQAVFDEHRDEMHMEMQKRLEEKLSQDVADGKITETQKQAILAKHLEMRSKMGTNRDTFKNMTEEERKAALEQERADLEEWANTNGIDLSYVRFGMKMHGGFGKGMMRAN